MQDPQYRLAIAWQNVAYNQPPHPSFYLDEAAPLPKKPVIRFTRGLEFRADRIFSADRDPRGTARPPSDNIDLNGSALMARSPATTSRALASAPVMLVCTVVVDELRRDRLRAFALEAIRDDAREIDERRFLVRRRLPGPEPIAFRRRRECARPSSCWSW